MTVYGVTDTGFVKKTYEIIKQELNDYASLIWPGCDLRPEGPIGQMIALEARGRADIWDKLQETYTTRDSNQASGAPLSALYTLLGVTRIPASATTVPIYNMGTNATNIPTGSNVRQPSNGLTYALTASVTISSATPHTVKIVASGPVTVGKVYQIILDGITTTVTAITGDTLTEITNALALALADAHGINTVLTTTATDIWLRKVDQTTYAYTSNQNLTVTPGVLGIYAGTQTGPLPAPAQTISEILNPISGWASIWQPDAGETGRYAEDDATFRARAPTYFANARGTDESIRQGILNEVEGVTSCRVISNRQQVEVNGQSAGSYQAIVEGGADQDIGNALWKYQSSGVESFGSTLHGVTVTVTDTEGNPQTVRFSRPSSALIWVKIQRQKLGNYPLNGDDTIKSDIVDWALANYTAGETVYRRAIATPVNQTEGLGDVKILLGDTTDGTTPTAYLESDIAVDPSVIPSIALARITVEDF